MDAARRRVHARVGAPAKVDAWTRCVLAQLAECLLQLRLHGRLTLLKLRAIEAGSDILYPQRVPSRRRRPYFLIFSSLNSTRAFTRGSNLISCSFSMLALIALRMV